MKRMLRSVYSFFRNKKNDEDFKKDEQDKVTTRPQLRLRPKQLPPATVVQLSGDSCVAVVASTARLREVPVEFHIEKPEPAPRCSPPADKAIGPSIRRNSTALEDLHDQTFLNRHKKYEILEKRYISRDQEVIKHQLHLQQLAREKTIQQIVNGIHINDTPYQRLISVMSCLEKKTIRAHFVPSKIGGLPNDFSKSEKNIKENFLADSSTNNNKEDIHYADADLSFPEHKSEMIFSLNRDIQDSYARKRRSGKMSTQNLISGISSDKRTSLLKPAKEAVLSISKEQDNIPTFQIISEKSSTPCIIPNELKGHDLFVNEMCERVRKNMNSPRVEKKSINYSNVKKIFNSKSDHRQKKIEAKVETETRRILDTSLPLVRCNSSLKKMSAAYGNVNMKISNIKMVSDSSSNSDRKRRRSHSSLESNQTKKSPQKTFLRKSRRIAQKYSEIPPSNKDFRRRTSLRFKELAFGHILPDFSGTNHFENSNELNEIIRGKPS